MRKDAGEWWPRRGRGAVRPSLLGKTPLSVKWKPRQVARGAPGHQHPHRTACTALSVGTRKHSTTGHSWGTAQTKGHADSRQGALPALAAAWSPKTVPSRHRETGERETEQGGRSSTGQPQEAPQDASSMPCFPQNHPMAPQVLGATFTAAGPDRFPPPDTFQNGVSECNSGAQVGGSETEVEQGPWVGR